MLPRTALLHMHPSRFSSFSWCSTTPDAHSRHGAMSQRRKAAQQRSVVSTKLVVVRDLGFGGAGRAGWVSEVLACGAECSAHAEDVCECTKANEVWSSEMWSKLHHGLYSSMCLIHRGALQRCMNTQSSHTQKGEKKTVAKYVC